MERGEFGARTGAGGLPLPAVLLTGGNGFVGSRVARRLARLGYPVRALVRRKGGSPDLAVPSTVEVEGDFVDPSVVGPAARGCALAIHCAATAGSDLAAVRRVNLGGTRAVVDAALAAGCTRFVHISTVSVYAEGPELTVDEDSPLKGEGEPYGVTKAEADRAVLEAMTRGLRPTILRPGAILGAHPTSTWAVRVPTRVRDRVIHLEAGGADWLPWVHVENLVDAVLLVLQSDGAAGRVYNMVDGHVTWRAYTDEVRSWFGTPPLEDVPAADLPAGQPWMGRFEAQRIRAELGYAPRLTYGEGMAEAAEYWRRP